jgi:hypothetical protein
VPYARGMKVGHFLVGPVGCWLLLAGCGDSSDGDDDAETGDGAEVDWSKVAPPDNLDITTCRAITEEQDPELDQCSACCMGAGFQAASFLNDGHCTCGANRADHRDTICMTQPAQATFEACQSCCGTAGFNGTSWVGGASGFCNCNGRSDTAVCADSVAGSASDEACFFCCLNQGFLSAGYTNFGEEECMCLDP